MEIDVFISYSSKEFGEASLVKNVLLQNGITVWMAPESIPAGSNYTKEIPIAIKQCKVFLLMLSQNAQDSVWVSAEVESAFKNGKLILPFVIEECFLTDEFDFLLSRSQRIEAYDKKADAFENLVNRIKSLINAESQKNGKEYRFISNIPIARDVFHGRGPIIEEIEKRFSDGVRVIFLEGIGGIGKSEIAKNYVKKYRSEYENVAFLTYNDSLKKLVCAPDGIVFEDLEQGTQSEEEFFVRKMQILRSTCDEKTLIIVDNFDTDFDENLNAFLEGTHRVIFTTRNAHPNYSSIKIEPIQDETILFKIFEENYGEIVSTEDITILKKLFALIENHTYMIELIAKQMQASFLTAQEMYDIIKTGTLQSAVNESVQGRHAQKTSFGHLSTLFNLSDLSQEEKSIMQMLSLMGTKGVLAKRFKEWSQMDNMEIMTKLIRRSWVRKDYTYLSVHPLVTEVVRVNMPELCEGTIKYLNNMSKFSYWAWHREYQENLAISDNISQVLSYFSPFKSSEAMYIEPLASLLWQVGRFDESIKYLHILYDTCLQELGEANMVTGFVAKGLAGAYFNSRREKESVQWYEKGLDHMLKANCGDNEDLALAYIKVARCYTWEFNFNPEMAQEYFKKALEMRERLNDMFEQNIAPPETLTPFSEYSKEQAERNVAGINMEIGRMYQVLGDYEKALHHARIYKNYMENDKRQIRSNIAYGLYDVGVCEYHLGLRTNGEEADEHFAEAEKNLKKALELNMEMRGGLAVDTIDNQEYLGDLYVATNRFSEASNAYMAVINMLEKLYGGDYERIEKVKEKMKF